MHAVEAVRFVPQADPCRGRPVRTGNLRQSTKVRRFPGVRRGSFTGFLILLSMGLAARERAGQASGNNPPAVKFARALVSGADDPRNAGQFSGRVSIGELGAQIVLYSKGIVEGIVGPPRAAFVKVLPAEGVFTLATEHGAPPFWLRWWFPLACAGVGLAAIFAFYRLRLHHAAKIMNLRFEERLTERMRVAHELHDALLQGAISASMQLDVAVDHLPPDSPVKPALCHILKIMDQIVEEGRTTLQVLRSSAEGAHDLEIAFSHVPEELGLDQRTAYRVLVEGTPLPLQAIIHKEVYSIGREAIVNAFRHSGTSNVEVELEYSSARLQVRIRDNGRGIMPEALRTGHDAHEDLSGMRERAERIGAKFELASGSSAGTEVELSVPGHIAFQVPPSNGRWGWFSNAKLLVSRSRVETPKVESEILK